MYRMMKTVNFSEFRMFLEEVLQRGWYGNKTGQGFYKKTPEGILTAGSRQQWNIVRKLSQYFHRWRW